MTIKGEWYDKAEIDAFRAQGAQEVAGIKQRLLALENIVDKAPNPPAGEHPEQPGTSEPPKDDGPVEPENPHHPPARMLDYLVEEIDHLDVVGTYPPWSLNADRYFRAERRIRWRGKVSVEFAHNMRQTIEGVHKLQLCPWGEENRDKWFTVAEAEPTGHRGTFSFHVGLIPDNWYWQRVVRPDGRTSPRYPVFIVNGDRFPKQTHYPVCSSNYELMTGHPAISAALPVGYDPLEVPMRARPLLEPGKTLLQDSTFVQHVVVYRNDTTRMPTVGKYGEIGSEADQIYDTNDITSARSRFPIIGGKRGRAWLPVANWIQEGHDGITWGCTSWCLWMAKKDAEIVILAGEEHDPNAVPYWEDLDELPLRRVGDWSAMPYDHFRELWGALILESTVGVELIDGKMMHSKNPIFILADTQHNSLVMCEFDGTKQPGEVPCKLSIWLDGLDDPWLPIEGPPGSNEVAVVERFANRVGIYDVTDPRKPVFRRWLVDNSADRDLMHCHTGIESQSRFARYSRNASVEHLRSRTLIWPENGAGWTDDNGEYWIVLPSSATEQVLRFRWSDGKREVDIDHYPTLSFMGVPTTLTIDTHGYVYPKGTRLISGWSANQYGTPQPFQPRMGDEPSKSLPIVNWYRYGTPNGRGRGVSDAGYAACAYAGRQGLVWSGGKASLMKCSPALVEDPPYNAAMAERGFKEWHANGHEVVLGDSAFPNRKDIPIPEGASADLKWFIDHCRAG